ncbi:hypothetical protein MTsPCn5_39480 [Croceitalea sp. MTPC5]|uniref:hypothetical protein n=1 Tax=Croceitalea sp. MTPC5 TaxID=3056565 RepID=UPI002B3E5D4C|nr:hypothetical protein MTsPCn5_39480 [Croceitalea sp. MTPC5]
MNFTFLSLFKGLSEQTWVIVLSVLPSSLRYTLVDSKGEMPDVIGGADHNKNYDKALRIIEG